MAPGADLGDFLNELIFSDTSEVAAALLCMMLGEHMAALEWTNRDALCIERLLEHS